MIVLVHSIPTILDFLCGMHALSINHYIENRVHGSRAKHSCPCFPQLPGSALSPHLLTSASPILALACQGVHSTWGR